MGTLVAPVGPKKAEELLARVAKPGDGRESLPKDRIGGLWKQKFKARWPEFLGLRIMTLRKKAPTDSPLILILKF